MLLIHPPVAKPCEPPAGITRLAGTLKANGIPCHLLDAALESCLFLLDKREESIDTWSRRASANCENHIAALQKPDLYRNRDRYRRAVSDLNRLLENSGRKNEVLISLSNYQDRRLSPLKSSDLIMAATSYRENPFFPYFSHRLTEFIASETPHFVGFSLNYLSQAITTFAMIGFLKDRFPALKIITGGGLVTSWLRSSGWENKFSGLIDHLVEGPGEIPLLEILGIDPPDIAHPPAFAGLNLDRYLSPGFVLPYAASSGCYWRKCSFCPENAEKTPYLQLGTGRVRSELAQLIKRYKPALVHFLDNAISPALLNDLADNPLNTKWYGFCRAERVLTDRDFCHRLKKSGCVMVKLGLESGDQGVLNRLDKGIDLETVSTVLANLKNAGIMTYVYLLFGTPAENLSAARRTMDFTISHADEITYLNLAIFNMPTGSPESSALAVKNFYDGDLSLYTDFIHPQAWDRKEVRLFLDREFSRHPEIAKIIRRDPPYFTSNHAPFFGIA